MLTVQYLNGEQESFDYSSSNVDKIKLWRIGLLSVSIKTLRPIKISVK